MVVVVGFAIACIGAVLLCEHKNVKINACFRMWKKQMYEHIWGDQLGVPTNLLSLFQLPLAAKLVTTKPKNMIAVV